MNQMNLSNSKKKAKKSQEVVTDAEKKQGQGLTNTNQNTAATSNPLYGSSQRNVMNQSNLDRIIQPPNYQGQFVIPPINS